MKTLGSIFYIFILCYSFFGGFMLWGEYGQTGIVAKNKKDYKKKSSKVNRIFLMKLIKYTLIVCIPTYFMKDISDFFGLDYYFYKESILIILAVPFILWACTLMLVIVNLFEKEKP